MEKYIENRPWGKFERFAYNEPCTVKLLYIEPGEELSLQYHQNRDEFIKIIQGQGEVTIGDKKMLAKKGDEFFIPKTTKHRVKAMNGEEMEILEISFGKFDENDEIRLEDKYNRK